MKTLLLALGASLCASFAPQDDAGFRPLFNGENFEGWVRVNTAPSTWTVVDGMLHCNGKPTGELRTERMYQNFVLEVEWRHMQSGGNGGIFVWADDITARGVPFHRSIEVQVLDHGYGNTDSHTTHGDIFPIHGATMKPINGRGGSRAFPTENRSKPSPEWNHYRITCQDGAIALEVNGKLVTRGEDCSPRKGYICLESEGGVVDYRNLRIKELQDTPVEEEDVAIADRGYQCLYSGVDLSGWRVAEAADGHWKPRDWVLVYDGKQTEGERWIETERAFGDVGFVIDVRPREGTGDVQLRLPGLDLGLNAEGRVVAGWNRYEGTVIGGQAQVRLNGQAFFTGRVGNPDGEVPLRVVPVGPVDLANLYVRELE